MRDRVTEELNTYLDSRDKWLESRPKCDYCGEHIQDDYLFDIDGEIICEECLNDNFRKSTDYYIN